MMYLFRISTKADVYSSIKAKPVYFVAASKEAAEAWARDNLKQGLKVARVTKLAKQLAPYVFSGDVK